MSYTDIGCTLTTENVARCSVAVKNNINEVDKK